MNFRPALLAFAAVIAGLSLLVGAVLTLQAGYALSAFSAQHHVSGIVGVGLLRVQAAHVALIAACCAVAIGIRARPMNTDSRRLCTDACMLLAAAIPATAVAASIALLSAAAVAATVFDIGVREFWPGLGQFTSLQDVEYGLFRAAIPVVCLSVLAIGLLPRLTRKEHRLFTRLAAAWLIGSVVLAVVDVVFEALTPDAATWSPGVNMV